jgi:hypothetical protein
VRRSVGGPIKITISETAPFGFDSRSVAELPRDLFKTLRDGSLDFLTGKLDERSVRVETFRPNMIVGSFRHRGRILAHPHQSGKKLCVANRLHRDCLHAALWNTQAITDRT